MQKLLQKFLNKPVHYKLTLMVMGITSVAVLVTCTAFITYDVRTTKQSMLKELVLISDIIGKRTAPGMQFPGGEFAEKAEQNLSDLKNNSSVVLACMYRNNGSVLAKYIAAVPYECPPQPGEELVKFSDNFLTVHSNIESIGKKVVGSIYIQADMREINQHMITFAIGIVVLMFLVLSVAYFLVRQVQKVISVPVQKLAVTAKSVTDSDDYALRAPRFYDDELGILVDAFNSMMDEVEKTRYNLEAIVSDRTKDLEKALHKAESSNRAKTDFLRNMSHEFRTPLHGIGSFAHFGKKDIAEALAKQPDDELLKEIGHYFNRISDSKERLEKLVDAVLKLTKLEEGKEEFIFKKSRLTEPVEIALAECTALMRQKGLELCYEKPEFDVAATFDSGKMVQVVTNILGNAMKFTPAGKQIRVAFKAAVLGTRPALTLMIFDQGVGIPEDELEKIFDKFTQSSRTNDGSGGTGLGLAITQKIITAHEGRIFAENNKEGGAVFYVTVPTDLSEEKRDVGTLQ